MEKRSNYDITRDKMEQQFTRYDQGEMIRKFQLRHTEQYLFLTFVSALYRVDRFSGRVERCAGEGGGAVYTHADFNESMTIFDVLCCSKPDCRLSGEYVTLANLPGVSKAAAPGMELYSNVAGQFANQTGRLHRACRRLHGTEQNLPAGDVSYRIPVFDFMPVLLQFWDADDEFDAALKIMWDKNVLDYMHFESTFYLLSHLFKRLTEA